MDNLKYALIKMGLVISWIGSVLMILFLIVNYVSEYKYANFTVQIIGFVLMALFLFLPLPLTNLRNKYRDIVEYDEAGISKEHGNFSRLSNQERAIIEKQKLLQREMLIDSVTLKNITKKGSVNPDEDLQKMIGLNNIKEEVHRMESRLKFQKETKKKKKHDNVLNTESANHMCFKGRAGTGKTEIVKIMTGILYKNKKIKKNQYIEVDGNFFNGNSFGESTAKIKYIMNIARGGVLFIDEAYAMLNNIESQEVIATLIAGLENNRSDFVVILAGYPNEMDRLIDSNTGFQSRIRYFFDFPDYKIDELWEIFKFMGKDKGFEIHETAKSNFTSYILEEMQKPNYGNARTVRTILDKAIDNHSVNYIDGIINSEYKMVIVPDDLPIKGKININKAIME